MQVKEARVRFQCGDIKKVIIVCALVKGWNVLLQLKSGDQILLSRYRGGEATYISLDAAFSAVKQIGFREALIKI